jgi:hypothetical protein
MQSSICAPFIDFKLMRIALAAPAAIEWRFNPFDTPLGDQQLQHSLQGLGLNIKMGCKIRQTYPFMPGKICAEL